MLVEAVMGVMMTMKNQKNARRCKPGCTEAAVQDRGRCVLAVHEHSVSQANFIGMNLDRAT